MSINSLILLLILQFVRQIEGLSYNQPKFCPDAKWNSSGITFADNQTFQSDIWDIFITTNNTIYVPMSNRNHILLWFDTNPVSTRSIPVNSFYTISVFVTEDNNVFFDYINNSFCGINKLTSSFQSIMISCDRCSDIFVDIKHDIYCSMDLAHMVIKKSSENFSDRIQIIAGTGNNDSTANTLNNPLGIFVDTNFDLYVADLYNNRIQLFPMDQTDGISVVGNGSLIPTIELFYPTGIVLDGNKYLFIADYGNRRIVGSGPNGFRCLIGCNGSSSSSFHWRSISFDKFGNIFALDSPNNRIEKFVLMTNSCNVTSDNNITYPSINTSSIIADNTSNNISYNQPKFDPLTVWNPNGIILAYSYTSGTRPFGIFINKNDSIYVVDINNKYICIWMNDGLNQTTTISMNPLYQSAIFVNINNEIYTSSVDTSYTVNKWTLNSPYNHTIVAYGNSISYGVFVDINNTLYFSLRDKHKVLSKSLRNSSNILTVVAGTGCPGNTAKTLNGPHGIFVDTNFDLYIADFVNHRIQLFRFGQQNGITIAGSGSLNTTITLLYPIHIVLDFDKNLFIVDSGNDRIVASGPNGFRCILGCTGSSGSNNNQFLYPVTMAFDSHGNIYVVDRNKDTVQKFLRLNTSHVLSYNQPKFCSNATWNSSAITIANNNTIGSQPHSLYIDTYNSIYVASFSTEQIIIWMNNSIVPNLTLHTGLTEPMAIFVTNNGDIYVANRNSVNQVIKSISYTNRSIPIFNVSSYCWSLFVDISNTLYCSMLDEHKILKKWLNDNTSTMTIIAGNGSNGFASNLLNNPRGIFVDTNFDLYVADGGNNRIQLFRLGQSNGITVAGSGSSNITITLNGPRNVILDGNKYLFIADSDNHRIIGSNENGFHCIVGCSNSSSSGSASDQLKNPRSIAFDSSGNLFVVDKDNHRIQKFTFLTQSCNQFYDTTQQSTVASTSLIHQSTPSVSSQFLVSNCHDKNIIGTECNISSNPCNLLNPCENGGSCQNVTTISRGYVCDCLRGFNGTRCQYDHRLCKPWTCWNNGKCNETSNTTFECLCQSGWTGEYCEKMINYCENITCENNALCRPLFMNYTCECLGENYSGRHCEIVSTKLVTLQFISKSFGYIAIIFLLVVVGFIVIMDVLKYGFGIDPTKHELERIRREKARKKALAKRRPVIQKFTYVNS